MYPKKLVLENFGPFESLYYDFEKEPIAVIGENKTQDDQLSNGSGKSFLSQGLFYGIYGVNLRGSQDKKLIRSETDHASTLVEIYCPIRRLTLIIVRELLTKSSSRLKLTERNEDGLEKPLTFATIADGNKLVVNWIEISPEDAKSYFIVSKGNYKSFFLASNTDKLALISRFINFSSVDKTKSIIQTEINDLNAEKQELEKQKASFEGRLSVFQENLKSIKEVPAEEKKKEALDKLENSIKFLNDQIIQWEKDIKLFQKDRDEMEVGLQDILKIKEGTQSELSKIDTTSFKAVLEEIEAGLREERKEKETKDELRKISKVRMIALQKTLNNLEILLSGVITCPNCRHQFLLDEKRSLQDLKVEEKITESAIEEEKEKCEEFDEIISEIDEAISQYNILRKETEIEEESLQKKHREILRKINSLEINYSETLNEISKIDCEIKILTNKINSNEHGIEDYLNKMLLVEEEDFVQDTSELVENIKNTETQISLKEKVILEKDNQIFKKQQWTLRFKDFKMYLAMEQLKNIQIRANDILKSMKSDLRLIVEGFKKDAKGNLKEEITVYIFRDEIETFSFYSGGEQARCEIALIIALQQMINTTKQFGGMQFLLIDEVLESADALGIENIISSLDFLKQSSLIITHVPKMNEEIRQIKIVKENSISTLQR